MVSDRAVSPEDSDFLFQVYASTRADEMAAWGWPAAQAGTFLRMQYRARNQSYAMAYAGADEYVLLCEGAPAGAAIVRRDSSEIRLVDIALLPEYRGRGLGGEWLAGLAREADDAGMPLRLSVAQGNQAIRLYQRLGFEPMQADAMYVEMERKPLGTHY